MAVSLASLRYAHATARLGSFSQAARACGVSQPTVSNAIAQLEEQLGGQLFARSTRAVVLTPFGEHMLPLVESAVTAEDELVREAQAFHDPPQKLVRIGFSPLMGGEQLVRLVQPFARQVPGVELVFKECSVDDMNNRLDKHRVDVVFTVRPPSKSRRSSIVFRKEVLHFLPRGGATAVTSRQSKVGISLAEIAQELLVFTRGDCGLAPATRELFRRRGLDITEYRGEAISYSVLEEWSELGIGAAILPRSCMRKDAALYPVVLDDAEPVELEYRAVWNHDALRPQHLTQFIGYIKEQLPKLISGQGLDVAG